MSSVQRLTRTPRVAMALGPVAVLAFLSVLAAETSAQTLKGTVTYRERMALPAGAVLEVTLADVSRADAPAEPVAITTARVPSPGLPPIPFSISYQPERILANRQYSVRARIVAADRLLFATDTATPVLTGGAPTTVALILRRVGGNTDSPAADGSLGGTSWQLVRFQGGDDAVLTPVDRAKYTLAFDARGGVAARVDCNRGRGTWKSNGANQVEFGPLALTRAQCPPGSLHDQIVKQWGNIRSYVLRDGHLFLSLMADGGIYEFEPVGGPSGSFRSSVRPTGPATWTCARPGAQPETLRVTFYTTRPGLVLLEHGGTTRPAFQTRAASGTRYEGDDVLFWEARGEATLNWLGVESTCRRG